MAKLRKGSKYELDDYGFSSDLDVPNFNFDAPNPKNDRKPSTTTKLGGAFLSGARDQALSPSFMRKVMKDALPKGYGQAMDLADTSIGSLKDLYNNTTREIKPAIKDMKRFTARVLPAAGKVLPKKVADRIKKWSADIDEDGYNGSVDAQRESMLTAQLGDIFAYQAESSAQDKAEADVRDKIREGLTQARHRDQLQQLDSIRQGIAQQTAYRLNVESKVQRKSLELQFRQFFLAKDQYEETRRNNAFMTEQIQAIRKNTGLPDWQKLTESEKLTQALRTKLFESVFSRRNNFVRNLTKNLGGMVMDKVTGFAGGIREGLAAGNMMMDAQDSMRDLGGPSMGEFGAGMAGSAATDFVGGKLSQRLGKHLAKHRGVVKLGNKLDRGVTNFPQIAGEWGRSTKGYNGNNGLWDMVVGFAKDLVSSSLGGTDNKMTVDNESNLNSPGVFTRQAHKSITEIIPGFLARIYQELQIMRTGADVELTSYDYTSNKFVSKSAASKAAFDKVVAGAGKTGTNNQVDQVLRKIDPDGTKLSPEQRKELGLKLLTDNMDNRYAGKDRLTNAASYGGSQHAQKYAALFEEHFKGDHSGQKQTEMANDIGRLGTYMTGTREGMQNQANLGMLDFMVEAGLVDPSTGTIDMQKLYSYYYGEEYKPSKAGAGGPVQGGLPGGSRKARRRAARASAYSQDINAMHVAQQAPKDSGEMKVPAELLAAIRENNIRQEATSMLQTLQNIEERLASGVPSISIDADEFMGKVAGKMNDRMNRMREKLRRSGRGVNMTLRQAARKTGRAASKGFGKVAGWVSGGIGATAKSAWTAGTASAKLGWQATKTTWDKIVGEADVFIKGEALPRLSAWKLAAGEYKDAATGKVIKTYKDISGDVIDTVTGKTVLWSSEIKQAFLKSGWGVKALEGLSSLGKRAKDLVGDLTGTAGKVAMGAYSQAMKLTKYLYEAEDVFTKDDLQTPKLLARIMKAGGYFSKNTGKVIKNSGDIDGPVVDKDQNEQLTLADLKSGIVGVGGKRLRVGGLKLLGGTLDMLGAGLKLAKQGLTGLGRGALNAVASVGNWFKNFVMPDGILFSGGKTIVERLTEIRDLLDQRMPGKRTAGDVDGDGIREGSYQDILNKRAKQGDKAKGDGKDADGKAPKGWAASLGAALNSLRGKKDEEKKDHEGGGLLSDAADAAEIADDVNDMRRGGRGGRGPKGKAGWGSRLKSFGGRALGMAGRAAGTAGMAYGAYSAYDNAKQGNYGAAALDAGLATATGITTFGGLGALGTAAGAVGGAALSGLGMLGTGLAAVVASPVALGLLAAAAVGAGAYYGYKALSKPGGMLGDKLSALNKLRYAQYGFTSEDTSHMSTVFALEDELWPGVTFSGMGGPQIDTKKIDLKKIYSLFGLDPQGNSDASKRFVSWFTGRFKPVFLSHASAANSVGFKGKLAELDSEKEELKKSYFGMVRACGGASELTSPFGDDPLQATPEYVAKIADEVEKELNGDKSGAKDAKTEPGKSGLANTAAAAAGAATSQMGAGKAPLEGGGVGAEQPTAMQTAVASFKGYVRTGSEVDALSAIRYKTYGLSEMVQEKVRALDMLEVYMQKGLSFNGDGQASWRGSAENALAELGPGFGVQGINNNSGYDWMSWFNTRFTPVYLNYVTALSKATKKTDLRSAMAALKASDAVDVAQAVFATAGAWRQTASPWPGYALNTQVSTTEENFQALKEVAKKAVLVEQTGTKQSKGTGADNGTGVTDGTKGSAPGVLGKAWNSVVETATGWAQKARDAAGSIGIAAYNATHTDPSMLSGGRRAADAGEGAGGAMADLPVPQGDGKYAYFQELFAKVAKIVGVDPKLMATMAAIESGFRASVKAPTSSATGLFQFISGTWNTMMRKYGAKFGIPFGTPPTDPRANALLGAAFLKENMQAIKGTKPDTTDTDLYLAHFLGAGGAKKFLAADPSAVAATVLPDAAKANASIFYERDGRPRTIAQVYAHLNTLVQQKGKQYGLDVSTGALPEGTASSGTAADPAKAAPSFPVSDQTPAPVAATASAADTPTGGAASNTPATAADPGTTPASTMSPRSQELTLQQQAQREDLSKVFDNLDSTGRASLAVQTDTLTVLRSIEKLVAARFGSQSAAANDSASAAAPAAKEQRRMSEPPISMAKSLNAVA